MEINQTKQSTKTGLQSDAQYSVNVDGNAFEVMMGSLYKDKPRAVVRETIANQRDAHTWRNQLYRTITPEKLESGNLSELERQLYDKLKAEGYADPSVTYKIHIPTDLEPWLEFEDFGIGMTVEEAIGPVDKAESEARGHQIRSGGLLNTLFKSNKRNENLSIGGFGLGCKCPLSVVDSFSYRIIKNFEEHQFIVYMGDNGIPDINWLTRDENYNPKPIKTTRENGVIVRLDTIPKSEFNYYKACVSDILQTFPDHEQPIINEGMYAFTPIVKEWIEEGKTYIVKEFRYGTILKNNYLVDVGGILYPINMETLISKVDPSTSCEQKVRFIDIVRKTNPIVFVCPIGSVKLPPSREEISYDKTTVDTLTAMFTPTFEKINERLEGIFSSIDWYDIDDFEAKYKELLFYYDLNKNNGSCEELKTRLETELGKQTIHEDYSISLVEKSMGRNMNLNGTYVYIEKILSLNIFKRDEYLKKFSLLRLFDYKDFTRPLLEQKVSDGGKNVWVTKFHKEKTDNKTDFRNIVFLDIDQEGISREEVNRKLNLVKEKFYKNVVQHPEREKLLEEFPQEVIQALYSVYRGSKSCVLSINTSSDYKEGILFGLPFFSKEIDETYEKAIDQVLKGCVKTNENGEEVLQFDEKRLEIVKKIESISQKDLTDLVEYLKTNYFHEAKTLKYSEIQPLNEALNKLIRSLKKVNTEAHIEEVKRNVFEISRMDEKHGFVNTTLTKTEAEDFLETESLILWMTEEEYKDQNKKYLKDGEINRDIEAKYFSEYVKSIGVEGIYIVRGLRTKSRLILENKENAMKIDLDSIYEDLSQKVKTDFFSGVHPVWDKFNYKLAWRLSLPTTLAYIIALESVFSNLHHGFLFKLMERVHKITKKNKYAKKYLEERFGIKNLEESLNFIRQFDFDEKYVNSNSEGEIDLGMGAPENSITSTKKGNRVYKELISHRDIFEKSHKIHSVFGLMNDEWLETQKKDDYVSVLPLEKAKKNYDFILKSTNDFINFHLYKNVKSQYNFKGSTLYSLLRIYSEEIVNQFVVMGVELYPSDKQAIIDITRFAKFLEERSNPICDNYRPFESITKEIYESSNITNNDEIVFSSVDSSKISNNLKKLYSRFDIEFDVEGLMDDIKRDISTRREKKIKRENAYAYTNYHTLKDDKGVISSILVHFGDENKKVKQLF